VKLGETMFGSNQWFESTPAQAFSKAILQVFKPFGGQLDIHFQ
jgi:hypothetical protein